MGNGNGMREKVVFHEREGPSSCQFVYSSYIGYPEFQLAVIAGLRSEYFFFQKLVKYAGLYYSCQNHESKT